MEIDGCELPLTQLREPRSFQKLPKLLDIKHLSNPVNTFLLDGNRGKNVLHNLPNAKADPILSHF